MLYFAYGSNMDRAQMRERCPAAQFISTALLSDYELQFTRTSKKRGGGTADIVPVAGKQVWGVIYHLTERDRERLDKKEGVAIGAYRPADLVVHPEGDMPRHLSVFTYVVCSKESPRPKPKKAYLQQILDGAEQWHLPASYLDMLRVIETAPLSEADTAKALARELATRAIKNNPYLWDQLKEQLADAQHVDVYGSMIHTDFLGAVQCEVKRLSGSDRALLKTHILPPPASVPGWNYLDLINGQIFLRARTAISKM
jgi:cation transport regulator ChaC